jgi:DNA adenine methylase
MRDTALTATTTTAKQGRRAVTKPALRYYGSKWRLAAWIVALFPAHQTYVEPLGGSAAVLLQKPAAAMEVYNDIEDDLVNFFRVLRDDPDALIHRLQLTPWARAEYQQSWQPSSDPVEAARRFFVRSQQDINGGAVLPPNRGWARVRRYTDKNPAAGFQQAVANLEAVAARLLQVQIECQDWWQVVTDYDGPDTLFYIDPPYLQRLRSGGRRYHHDWAEADHVEAAKMLRQVQGRVVVSGYAGQLYADLYEAYGWQRFARPTQTNKGARRIESIWLSPAAAGQITMF